MKIMRNRLSEIVTNPCLVSQYVRWRCLKFNQKYWNIKYDGGFYTKGDDFIEEDWDNLIILDACRYDIFKQICDIEGQLEYRISRGSMSEQFIRGNFGSKNLGDTVYVSANLWFQKLKKEINSDIHQFISVKRDSFGGVTSHPRTVTETAIEANKNYPNKKLICHYLQPHEPYFDYSGERFRLPGKFPCQLKNKNLTQASIIDAYRKSLSLTIDYVRNLLKHLEGKTVVTSDHGELLGDRIHPIPAVMYGHPRSIYINTLIRVPWLVVEDGKRKNIIEEDTNNSDPLSKDDVDSHLEALGYL